MSDKLGSNVLYATLVTKHFACWTVDACFVLTTIKIHTLMIFMVLETTIEDDRRLFESDCTYFIDNFIVIAIVKLSKNSLGCETRNESSNFEHL